MYVSSAKLNTETGDGKIKTFTKIFKHTTMGTGNNKKGSMLQEKSSLFNL